MPKKVVLPPRSAPPLAPYSPAVVAEGTLYISGTLAIGSEGQIVGQGSLAEQTRHVLNAIRDVVEAAGGSMDDVVHNAIFLKDLSDYATFNAIYGEYFPSDPPARYCIRADLVKPEFLVEISSTAYLGRRR